MRRAARAYLQEPGEQHLEDLEAACRELLLFSQPPGLDRFQELLNQFNMEANPDARTR